jgi:hypothetical protein
VPDSMVDAALLKQEGYSGVRWVEVLLMELSFPGTVNLWRYLQRQRLEELVLQPGTLVDNTKMLVTFCTCRCILSIMVVFEH